MRIFFTSNLVTSLSSIFHLSFLCLSPAFTVYTFVELLLADHSLSYFDYFKICLKIDLWFGKSFGSIRKTSAHNIV